MTIRFSRPTGGVAILAAMVLGPLAATCRYGVGWLAGSVTTGVLYQRSIPAVVALAVAIQLALVPLFVVARRAERDRPAAA